MRISDWSSDVCSSDLLGLHQTRRIRHHLARHFQKGAADIQRIECFRRDDASSFRVRCLTFQEVPDELLAPFRDLRHGLSVFYRVWPLYFPITLLPRLFIHYPTPILCATLYMFSANAPC